ncbi:winged helix-turn-helix transcriptional regulator [Prauserella cavernicola]|uniref:Helix-turn-helix transcriptional regulator n=1 Tax=Prauserella cavernicola TaxID=2800127 RepID=A0A934V673_9PSEU|nr:helix-turn-helix domain-containing protein [Prauserella cavernicola]MBK1785383.1 helix-turn-helix transcriptional regulator [Prauserella cavernicola]
MDEIDRLVPDVFARACASRGVLEHVASRWGGLALAALHEGPLRFNALRRRVDGVSEKMLAQTLQRLERDGFVHRDAQPSIPPRVEYSLTPLGVKTAAKLVELIELVESSLPEVFGAQAAYDTARDSASGNDLAAQRHQ